MSRIAKETFSVVAMLAFLAWFSIAALWATAVQGKRIEDQEPAL